MQIPLWSRAAGLVMPVVVVAAVLTGARPAAAYEGIGIDAAICLQNASGTLTSPRPTILDTGIPQVLDYPVLTWRATVQTTACSAANAKLRLLLDNQVTPDVLPAAGSAEVFFPGLWKLRLETMVGGSKDLASIRVTIG